MLLFARTTLGEPQDARTVEVILVGGGRETGSLVDTMRELLARLSLVPNVHAVTQIEDAEKIGIGTSAARLEIDLRSDKETTIVAIGKDGTPHTRTIHRDPSPAIAREELAHAIQTIAMAQLFPELHAPEQDAAAPEPEASAPPPVIEVTPPPEVTPPQHDALPPEKSPWALDVSVLAGGTGFSDNSGPVARVMGSVAVVRRKGLRPSLAFEVHGVFPWAMEGTQVTARASDVGLRSMAGLSFVHTSWFTLAGLAGGGVDIVTVDPSSRVLGASAIANGTTRASPILSAALGADFAIVSSVVITLRAVTDFDLGDTHHYIDRMNGDVVFSPWHVRPALLLGLSFTPFGPAQMEKR